MTRPWRHLAKRFGAPIGLTIASILGTISTIELCIDHAEANAIAKRASWEETLLPLRQAAQRELAQMMITGIEGHHDGDRDDENVEKRRRLLFVVEKVNEPERRWKDALSDVVDMKISWDDTKQKMNHVFCRRRDRDD